MRNKLLNNRGQMTIFIFMLIFIAFVAVIFIFVGGLTAVKINSALDQDVMIGSVNLSQTNADTFGQFTTAYLNNAEFWGLSIIFGMILGLVGAAYFLRNKFPKFLIIFDIFIIFVAFIVALYLSSTYQIVIDTFGIAGEIFMEDYTPKTAKFVLNLPIFVVIIGVLLMVILHSSIPRKKEEEIYQGGIVQGAY